MNEQKSKVQSWLKFGKTLRVIFILIILLLIIGFIVANWLIDYIWMDTLGFNTVFLTIFTSKVSLGLAGFLLFFIFTYFTLYWIRRSYLSHFGKEQLPPFMLHRKRTNLIILGGSIFIGLIGSSIVQGIGWEPALKLLNYEQFNANDPYFNMDVSFYVFVLPFVQFIVNILLGLSIFFLLIEIGAYSVFHMYRMNRSAQLHLGVTMGIFGILLACIHLLQPFETLLTNQVNLFQKSAVYGLSFTDQMVNIPKAYILAAIALIGTIWIIIAMVRNNIQSAVKPVVAYVGLLVMVSTIL